MSRTVLSTAAWPVEGSLEAVAGRIDDADGQAEVGVVDALDDIAVDRYFKAVVEPSRPIDIEVNATGPRAANYGIGIPAGDLAVDQFVTA